MREKRGTHSFNNLGNLIHRGVCESGKLDAHRDGVFVASDVEVAEWETMVEAVKIGLLWALDETTD